ncbi:MAG: hypothetical protein PHW96_04680 [Candidatus Nanoarchaeia archaeon]|nr:hypothetical protein [Candidatus Nanoarchaeia archaeon]
MVKELILPGALIGIILTTVTLINDLPDFGFIQDFQDLGKALEAEDTQRVSDISKIIVVEYFVNALSGAAILPLLKLLSEIRV